jgi:hypothetical protein
MWMRFMKFGAVAAVGLAIALPFAGSASAKEPYWANFHTPGKAAYCQVVPDITGGDAGPGFIPPLECWTPNDGFSVRLTAHGGRPKYGYWNWNKWLYSPSRLLGFGQSWWSNSDSKQGFGTSPRGMVHFRCRSQASGLTCRNRKGHGFWFGRFRGYRIF